MPICICKHFHLTSDVNIPFKLLLISSVEQIWPLWNVLPQSPSHFIEHTHTTLLMISEPLIVTQATKWPNFAGKISTCFFLVSCFTCC